MASHSISQHLENINVEGNNHHIGITNYATQDPEIAKTKTLLVDHSAKYYEPPHPEMSLGEELSKSIFDDARFRKCLHNFGHTLVFTGQPGVGKSTTMLELLRLLDKHRSPSQDRDIPEHGKDDVTNDAPKQVKYQHSSDQLEENVVIASIFFRCNEKQVPEKVLMLFLAQLVRKTTPRGIDHAVKMFSKHNNTMPPLESITETIVDVLKETPRACIFVDAIDECDPEVLSVVLQNVKLAQSRTNTGVVLSTQSSYRSTWEKHFPGAEPMEVRGHPNDIGKFLDVEITDLNTPDWFKEAETRKKIKKIIVDSSHGIFLLARLQFNYVKHTTSLGRLEEELSILESGTSCANGSCFYVKEVLEEVYRKYLDRVLILRPEKRKERAVSTLGYIRDAFRPLTIAELNGLLDLEASSTASSSWDGIAQFCYGLIEVNALGCVLFVHRTLQVYLESERGKQQIPDHNGELGNASLKYMSLPSCLDGICPDNNAFEKRLQDWPSLNYAARYWQIHFRQYKPNKKADMIFDQSDTFHSSVMQFLSDNAQVESAFQITQFDDWTLRKATKRLKTKKGERRTLLPFEILHKIFYDTLSFRSTRITGLHLVCTYGLHLLVKRFLEGPLSDLNACTAFDQTPLHFAVAFGDSDIVKRLLEAGASPDCKDCRGFTPFYMAIALGDQSIAEILLERQPRLDVNARTKALSFTTATIILPPRIHEGVPDISIPTAKMSPTGSCTALIAAACNNNIDGLKMLLQDVRTKVDIRDSSGNTALLKAAEKGHLDIVEALLDRCKDQSYWSMFLHWWYGTYASSTTERSATGDTALHKASQYDGCYRVVEYFVKRDPTLCWTRDRAGQIPLHLAVRAEALRNVEALLGTEHAGVYALDSSHRTPIHEAAGVSSPILELLLRRATSTVYLKDARGMTPLHEAARNSREQNVRLLLNRASKNELKRDSAVLLALATFSRKFEAFHLLWNHVSISRESIRHYHEVLSTERFHPKVVDLIGVWHLEQQASGRYGRYGYPSLLFGVSQIYLRRYPTLCGVHTNLYSSSIVSSA